MSIGRQIGVTLVAGVAGGLVVLGMGGRVLMALLTLTTEEPARFTVVGTLQVAGAGARAICPGGIRWRKSSLLQSSLSAQQSCFLRCSWPMVWAWCGSWACSNDGVNEVPTLRSAGNAPGEIGLCELVPSSLAARTRSLGLPVGDFVPPRVVRHPPRLRTVGPR